MIGQTAESAFIKGSETGLRSLLADGRWRYAVTATFNRETTPHRGRDLLKAFAARIDRALLGRKWCKQPRERRVEGIFVPEYGPKQGGFHYHGCVRVAPEFVCGFLSQAKPTWRLIVPSGQMDVTPITDAAGWARYVLKSATPSIMSDFVLLSEFHPS